MAGMKLLGGGPEASSLQAIVYIVIIGVIIYLIYKGKIPNPVTWIKKKLNPGSGSTDSTSSVTEAFTHPIKWLKSKFNKKEGIGGQIYGVGQTSSTEDGSGTYGYAKALTYDLQRNIDESMEHRLLSGARATDMKNLRKLAGKEGLANLHLEKFKPEDSVGFAKPYSEKLTNLEKDLYKKGIGQAIMGVYNAPYASSMGAASFANANVKKNLEGFNQVGPFLAGQNIGGLAINPETYDNIKVPKRNEYFIEPVSALKARAITEQDLSPNIAFMGAPFGFQDPTQTDMRVKRSTERFGSSPYSSQKFGNAKSTITSLGTSGANIPYTTRKARFLARYKDSTCPCNLNISDDPTKQSAYSQQYRECIDKNKCTIGTQLDAISVMNPNDTIELAELAAKYTKPQLKFIDQIAALKLKKTLTKAEAKELASMQSFYNSHANDLDRIHELVANAVATLANQQYLTPSHPTSNACRVSNGLIVRDETGNIKRYSKFVPPNSCDYVDFRINKSGNYDTTLANSGIEASDLGLSGDQFNKYKDNLEKAFGTK
jgi:hypothetical protein